MNQLVTPPIKRRIVSIDALRAFALFGIILVHTIPQFGCGVLDTQSSAIDLHAARFVLSLFENRCATIFCVLFGVSFYIILKNPSYTSRKFVWRCFLLMLIGIFDKIFYWADALMWYGICGMLLVSVRRFNCKFLASAIIFLFCLCFFLSRMSLGSCLDEYIGDAHDLRYSQGASLTAAIGLVPKAMAYYIRIVLNGGVCMTFVKFMMGYLIGKLGLIEIMDERVGVKHLLSSLVLYLTFSFLFSHSTHFTWWMKQGYVLSGALFYSLMVIYLYNHTPLKSLLSFFSYYGRCGLTNYMFQGIVGVIFFCHIGIAWMHYGISVLLAGSVIFYILQSVFCYYWLQSFRNGPMEYIWRCGIERRILPFCK